MIPRTFRLTQGLMSLVVLFAFATSAAFAQAVRFPLPSPNAMLKQSLGITDITITYSRPGVKGREVWGKLVPFNELWRTGANAATVLEVSDEVMIEGQKLPAGKYSLFTIPAQTGEWTLVINKNPALGGTAGYKQEEDVFRAKVKPQMQTASREWLEFAFEDLSDTSANIVLYWERLRLPMKVTVNTSELAFSKARTAVAAGQGANIGFANYALQTNSNLEEAMKMMDASIAVQETYRNHVIKARLLEKMGKKADAVKFLEKGIVMGKAMKNAPFDLEDNEKMLATWKPSTPSKK